MSWMHVTPMDLRTVRQDGLRIRFAMLGSMAYAIAETPESGSTGTSLERPCVLPHWGMVVRGDLRFVSDRGRETIPAGRIFHIPAGGSEHHFESDGSALIAGFQPVETDLDLSEARLEAQGFEIVSDPSTASVVPPIADRQVAPGSIDCETWEMAQFVMSRVKMGERSGYTSGWCDAPHWGIVTDGRLAIEWEDDVEVLAKGDIFHCPAGPPGHRIEAADPAVFIDLTPVSALAGEGRLTEWRRALVIEPVSSSRGIAVATLG
jgi:quercetin dioxygenase-like cupin family protein